MDAPTPVKMIKRTRMYVNDTGKQINFIPLHADGAGRESVCQLFVDHDVGAMHGIQGENFFRSIYEHLDDMFAIVAIFTGHIWTAHVALYRSLGLDVHVHHECVIDGTPSSFVIVSRPEHGIEGEPLLTVAGDGGSY